MKSVARKRRNIKLYYKSVAMPFCRNLGAVRASGAAEAGKMHRILPEIVRHRRLIVGWHAGSGTGHSCRDHERRAPQRSPGRRRLIDLEKFKACSDYCCIRKSSSMPTFSFASSSPTTTTARLLLRVVEWARPPRHPSPTNATALALNCPTRS